MRVWDSDAPSSGCCPILGPLAADCAHNQENAEASDSKEITHHVVAGPSSTRTESQSAILVHGRCADEWQKITPTWPTSVLEQAIALGFLKSSSHAQGKAYFLDIDDLV